MGVEDLSAEDLLEDLRTVPKENAIEMDDDPQVQNKTRRHEHSSGRSTNYTYKTDSCLLPFWDYCRETFQFRMTPVTVTSP